jgi:hypothetical protein
LINRVQVFGEAGEFIALDVFENDIEFTVVIPKIFGANDMRVLELRRESCLVLETSDKDGGSSVK